MSDPVVGSLIALDIGRKRQAETKKTQGPMRGPLESFSAAKNKKESDPNPYTLCRTPKSRQKLDNNNECI
jgi:hypothetical protein